MPPSANEPPRPWRDHRASPFRARDQDGRRADPRDAGAARTTWRWSSTSTAAPPGLVTLEDLLEELVGDIVDEYDREAPTRSARRQRSASHGGMPIDELNDLLDADLPDDDWDTVGGLIFSELGARARDRRVDRPPPWKFTVEAVDGRRIATGAADRIPTGSRSTRRQTELSASPLWALCCELVCCELPLGGS